MAGCVVLAGCTASPDTAAPATIVHTSTVTRTSAPPPITFTPPPARAAAPLAPGAAVPKGQVAKRCPYIASTPEQNADANVADIIGSHVLRTTVLTTLRPVGCRFYFYAPPYYAIADIVPRRFASAADAHNAMVLTARAGTEAMGQPSIVPGVDAVLYRTAFVPGDAGRDWACVFAKGATMVIVHSQQDDTSLNALNLAKQIATKF